MIKIQTNKIIKIYELNDGINLIKNIMKHYIANQYIFLKSMIKYIFKNNGVNKCNNNLIEYIIKILLNDALNVNII